MDQIALLIPLVAGIAATVFTIVIHSVAPTAVIGFVRRCVCYVVASEPTPGDQDIGLNKLRKFISPRRFNLRR
jgi:hypothetical protein